MIPDMPRTLVATAYVFRHGQRSPYPPPKTANWTEAVRLWRTDGRGFPDMTPAFWNMSHEAFVEQQLNGHGKLLLKHMGEHVAQQTAELGDPCSRSVLLIADNSTRDNQSAVAFADGFYPAECVVARKAQIVYANAANGLPPTTSDDNTEVGCGTGPDEQQAMLDFGESTSALTALYRPQLRRVSELLSCCSPELCALYGHTGGGSCTIDELPYTFNGMYWKGLYEGPLSAAGCFIQAWMLQALSGHEIARGELSVSELADLYRVHMRLMWLGSNQNRSQSVGSQQLAYLLASLEQVVSGSPIAGAADGSPRTLALFAHDFNLLYLRRLLGVHWLTDSFDFDVATTGAAVSFELHRDASAAPSGFRVRGVLTAATIEQQRAAASLLETPPSHAVFLDEPYDAFKARALGGLQPSCVLPRLRPAILAMGTAAAAEALNAPHAQSAAAPLAWCGYAAVALALVLAGGVLGFLCGGRRSYAPSNQELAAPMLPPSPRSARRNLRFEGSDGE